MCGLIQGAADGQAAAVEDVSVDHGRLDILVSKELLDRPDVAVVLKRWVASSGAGCGGRPA